MIAAILVVTAVTAVTAFYLSAVSALYKEFYLSASCKNRNCISTFF